MKNAGLYEQLMIDKNVVQHGTVSMTWLGTSAIFVTDGKTGILIDPYVSRFSLIKTLLGSPLMPDRPLIQKWVEKIGRNNIHAVIVSHSHFDHVADAPYFAIETDAPLIGTESTINVGRGAGMAESQLIEAKPDQVMKFGDFTVKFIESEHGLFMGRTLYPGKIDKPLIPPVAAEEYKVGGVFALLIKHPAGTVLHHGSAGFKPGMYDGTVADVDILLLGIASRGDTETYLENVALKSRPRLVIPVHLDNFFKPLEHGMSFLPGMKFNEFYRKTEKHQSVFTVRTVPFCKTVTILPFETTK